MSRFKLVLRVPFSRIAFRGIGAGKTGRSPAYFLGAPLFWWWMRKTYFEHYDAVASQDWYKQPKREKRIKATKLVVTGLSAVAFGAWLAHEFWRTGSILDVLNEVREVGVLFYWLACTDCVQGNCIQTWEAR